MEPAPPVRTSARAMLGSGLFVAVATVAANGLNAGFQVALARILSPAEYSLLLSLIVVTLIAAVPPLAFQASVAREVAVSLAEGRRGEAGAAIRDTVRGLSVWAAVVVVAGAARLTVRRLGRPGDGRDDRRGAWSSRPSGVVSSGRACFSSTASRSSPSQGRGSPPASGSASRAAVRRR